ncbi:MAG TPA: hypothetical protein VL588_04750 [Bdellovibrionota bacterium]|jgi:5-carboxymethyl-2-hydroxymuconate isomerase|nr:hypothetical protein [Bdellovibrionota bacterium]
MPHLTIEASKTLKTKIAFNSLTRTLHLSLKGIPDIAMDRLKTRHFFSEAPVTGEDAKPLKMIHVTLAVLSGRDVETRKSYGARILEALQSAVPKGARKDLSLTVEVREMEREAYFRS